MTNRRAPFNVPSAIAGTGGLPLAGDVNGIASANHVDALSGAGAGAGVQANTFIKWVNGGAVPPTTGQIRFPQPVDGLNNSYEAIKTRTAIGAAAPADLQVVTFWEQPVNQTTLQIGDTNFFYTTLVGGSNGYAAMATASVTGSVAGTYMLVRSDGLAGLNCARALGNPIFEMSDVLAADYAARFEVNFNGTTCLRYGPSVTDAQCYAFDGVNNRRIYEFIPGAGGSITFGDALIVTGSLFAQILTAGSANFGLLADSGIGYAALRTIAAPLVQVSNPGGARRVSALNALGVVGGASMPANTGDGVTYFAQATTNPTANPVGGVIMFEDAGGPDQMAYRTPAGAVITF